MAYHHLLIRSPATPQQHSQYYTLLDATLTKDFFLVPFGRNCLVQIFYSEFKHKNKMMENKVMKEVVYSDTCPLSCLKKKGNETDSESDCDRQRLSFVERVHCVT